MKALAERCCAVAPEQRPAFQQIAAELVDLGRTSSPQGDLSGLRPLTARVKDKKILESTPRSPRFNSKFQSRGKSNKIDPTASAPPAEPEPERKQSVFDTFSATVLKTFRSDPDDSPANSATDRGEASESKDSSSRV